MLSVPVVQIQPFFRSLFSPCKTSAWQNTMVRLLLDPRFSTTPQLTKMVRSSITARDFTLKKIVNSRLDRLPFLE
jgi:hypothetical protein